MVKCSHTIDFFFLRLLGRVSGVLNALFSSCIVTASALFCSWFAITIALSSSRVASA
uniref:Zinc finger BED domain-containing protein DAYSLEEPER n=1 Tax=Rhizophora mucronata TaxID=61149 RepID=A0A2P2JG31_RHIMU